MTYVSRKWQRGLNPDAMAHLWSRLSAIRCVHLDTRISFIEVREKNMLLISSSRNTYFEREKENILNYTDVASTCFIVTVIQNAFSSQLHVSLKTNGILDLFI